MKALLLGILVTAGCMLPQKTWSEQELIYAADSIQVGMTLEQARKASGVTPTSTREKEALELDAYYGRGDSTSYLMVIYRDAIVVRVEGVIGRKRVTKAAPAK